jgi:hypothetical protein
VVAALVHLSPILSEERVGVLPRVATCAVSWSVVERPLGGGELSAGGSEVWVGASEFVTADPTVPTRVCEGPLSRLTSIRNNGLACSGATPDPPYGARAARALLGCRDSHLMLCRRVSAPSNSRRRGFESGVGAQIVHQVGVLTRG